MTVYFASPGDNLQTKASILLPGDTLILNDGTYSGTPLYITGIHGSAAQPITIKAAHDGQAIIDGLTTVHPLFLSNASYVTIQGVVVQNSVESVVYLYAGTGSGNGSVSHITLQRITAHGAASGNYHVFDISAFSGFTLDTVLVEDCAGWGQGRYVFSTYHTTNVTFRRCYGYWQAEAGFTGAPRAAFNIYGALNTHLENCIGLHCAPTASGSTDYFTALYHTSDDTTNFPADNAHILGCIFYNNWEGYWINNFAGDGTLFKDCYFETPLNNNGFTTQDQGDGLANNNNAHSHTITNCTFKGCVRGFNRHNSSIGTFAVTNNVFHSNTTAMVNDAGHSYCGFYNNGALGTTLVGTDVTGNPGFDTTTYGRGGALFVPNGSPLKGVGQSGADIGANILYQYVDGVLTSTPLWPWPMESRIVSELTISPTYDIWNTLSNLYSGGVRIMSNPTDGHFIYEDISPDVGVGTYGPRLQQIAAGGFSGVLNYSLLNTNTAGMIGYINYAYSLGLKVIIALHTDQYWNFGHINQYPQLYADAGNPGTLQAMAAYIVNQCKNLSGTWGWYIADEPSPSNAAALLTWAGYIRSADTTGKPRLIVESWDDHTKNFSGLPTLPATSPWDSTYCDVGGDDFYPLGDTRNVWSSTASQAAAIQTACTARGIGSCMVLQSFGQTRYPSLQPRASNYPAGAPYPTTLQMQQQKDACLRNMSPRIILWYSYQDTNADWTDTFTSDTSGFRPNTGDLIYNQAHNDGGANGTWTWDTANSRLVQTGGTESTLELNGITAINGYVEAVMDESDSSAGLCARRVDSTHVYTLYLKDATSGNTFDLEVINGGYTSLASGSLPVSWTRGVQHTFRLTANGTTISATMDGTTLTSVTNSAISGAGKFGLIGGANARFYRMTVIPLGSESSTTHLANLANVVQSGLSHSLIDEAIYAQSPLRFYRLDDSTGFFAQDSGSAHSDSTYKNDNLGAGGSLVDVTLGQTTITSIDGQLAAAFGGSSGLVDLNTTGLPTGAQPWTLYAVVSMPTVQTGYKAVLWMGSAALYFTTQYRAGGELIASVQGVIDLRATSPAFTAGATYHVGATYDGSVLKLYINGALANSSTIGVINIGYGYGRIAADSGGDYNHCSIAKAVFDSKVWSATTFASIYAAATKTFPAATKRAGNHRAFARIG